jgi:hypothetical protein
VKAEEVGSAQRVGGGWLIDRRTFLKALGIGGAGLVAGSSLGAAGDMLSASVSAPGDPISDLALELEFDRERIFRFVSEQIRYEPYAGVLRGAEGTLSARSGSSADQAVLLAALLDASGVRTRFAEGTLDSPTADAIMASAVTEAVSARQDFVQALSGTGQGGRPFVAPQADAATRASRDGAVARAEDVATWAQEQLDGTVAIIEAALAEAGIALPAGFTALPGPERDGHLWVQAASGPAWLDLDPSLPRAIPGDAPGAASMTHDVLPKVLRHRLSFAIIGETAMGGILREETLLEADAFADELAGLSIGVLNVEREGLKAIGANIEAGLEGGTTYLPCLVLGDDVAVGPGVLRFGGDPSADPFGPVAAATAGPAEGEPTAEWVQVTITSPGAAPIVVRREIFDRIGPAARAAGAPDLASLPIAELVQLEPATPADYLPALRSHWLTVHNGILGGEALGRALEDTEVERALAKPVHMYHTVREAAGVALGLPAGARMFAARPNLVSMTVGQGVDGDGQLVISPSLDIWHRELEAVPVSDVAQSMPVRVMAGVLAHVTERLMTGDAGDGGPGPTAASVGALFDAAGQRGIEMGIFTDTSQVAILPYPPDAKERLREAVEAGWVAIGPVRPVTLGDTERVGWWLVEPSTGSTVDQMDDGRGVVIGGQTVVMRTVFMRATAPMRRLGLCLAIAAVTAATVILSEGIAGAYGDLDEGLGVLVTFGAIGAAGGAVGGAALGSPGVCAA